MAEKFDKLVKICEETCKKEFQDYKKDYRTFLDAYANGIAITATYSGVYSGSGGKSWPKDFFADAPNPATYGELFTWMYDKTYGSRYYSQKDAGEDASVYLDDITGKEYATRVAAADRVPMAKGDDDNLDDIIEAGLKGKANLEGIYKDLNRNWRDTQNYLIYKKIIEEITIPVFSEKVVKQYLDKVTNAKLKEWKKEDPGKIWRDGLQGKSSMQSDVGIIDFVAREYPLYQEVYGGNFWTTIDNPWSTRNGGPEAEQALLDAILEKSNDPSLNTPTGGPSMSETSSATGMSGSGMSASGPSASEPTKYKPFVEGLIDGFLIDPKTDLPDFKIYVSDPDTWKVLGLEGEEGEFVNVEGAYIDGAEPDEYAEEEYAGLSEEEVRIQGVVSVSQEDVTKVENNTPPASETEIQSAIKTTKVSSEDALYDLAGTLARKLGKNSRVNSENMRKGYIKGVHGLCPQGTQAMLAALTGISGLGQITGNADWFSFKNPGTGGGNSTFVKTVGGKIYFNDKVKITQIDGSWKGTYLDKKSKDKWQVGDVIAMGYKGGKPYGHIQVWTGTSWQSDFKQGNSIQQNNVDPDTVALWRLNQNGIDAVNNQMKGIA